MDFACIAGFIMLCFVLAKMYFAFESKKAAAEQDAKLEATKLEHEMILQKTQIYANRDIEAARMESSLMNGGNSDSEPDMMSQIMQLLPALTALKGGNTPAAGAGDIGQILSQINPETIKNITSSLGISGEKKI